MPKKDTVSSSKIFLPPSFELYVKHALQQTQVSAVILDMELEEEGTKQSETFEQVV